MSAPYVEECRAHTASVKPRHPDVLKELHRIHRLMHAGKPYAFEQSLLCELIREIEQLRGASHNAPSVKTPGEAFLNEADHAALFTFYNQCDDMDADGYTVQKEDMKRLAELGCVQHKGFGRYEVTRFGDWIIESTFLQNPTLPLRTAADYNAEQAKKVPRG